MVLVEAAVALVAVVAEIEVEEADSEAVVVASEDVAAIEVAVDVEEIEVVAEEEVAAVEVPEEVSEPELKSLSNPIPVSQASSCQEARMISFSRITLPLVSPFTTKSASQQR